MLLGRFFLIFVLSVHSCWCGYFPHSIILLIYAVSCVYICQISYYMPVNTKKILQTLVSYFFCDKLSQNVNYGIFLRTSFYIFCWPAKRTARVAC